VVDHQRPVCAGEQLAQSDRSNGSVAGVDVRRTFLEYIVLHDRACGKVPAKVRNPFALVHQLNFC
jgi:hypothetical protein